MPRRCVARRVGDDQRRHPAGVSEHDLLCDVPAEAQADQTDAFEVQLVEQGDDVVDGCRERERPRCGRLAVPVQVGYHHAEAGLQRLDLGAPGVVVERRAVQEDDDRPRLGASDPVARRDALANQLVPFHGSTFVVGAGLAGERRVDAERPTTQSSGDRCTDTSALGGCGTSASPATDAPPSRRYAGDRGIRPRLIRLCLTGLCR
jgi:hypothetical protein